jgi:ubiquinone/menaquinone biosynthesis C-methylase UbiE
MFGFITKSDLWDALDRGMLEKVRGRLSFQLKTSQDLWVYSMISGEHGMKIAEIGGGESRVLPLMACNNECYNIEKFEGADNGPSQEVHIEGVRNIRTFMGEFSADISDECFDILFSISVVEHIQDEDFNEFLEDCVRTLKPGGYMVHAIDMYVSDSPTPFWTNRYKMYKSAVLGHPQLEPMGSVSNNELAFSCEHASNPDNILYGWKTLSPNLDALRQNAQSISLKLGARKRLSTLN